MRKSNLVLVLVLVLFSGWSGYYLGQQKIRIDFKNWKPAVVVNKFPSVSGKQSDVDFTLFWTVWDKVSEKYVDKTKIDSKKMVDGAIAGMVASLGDPYTSYLPVVQNKESHEDLGGAFEGVGIQLGYKDGHLTVVAPLPETPAAKAGVKAGDFIVRIKDSANNVDRDTEGISLPEAVKLIRGKGGTKVLLTLVRSDVDKPFDVTLARDTIVVKSVVKEYRTVGGKKIAWVKLSRFGERTQQEWNEMVNQIGSDTKGMVLDVRNNPGGYLDGAVYIAGEFLQPGKLVVAQQYGDGSRIDDKVERNGKLLKLPLIVLVNNGSASASEILAGALQDYKRAKIVGELSFGKGSVQQPEDFPDGSGIHITVAKWLRPSGDWIDKKGITPDVEVKFEADKNDDTKDNQLEKALELF